MKKFKIEYGIVREYDEVTLWFEPIDDDLDALVLRNRSGEILSVFTEQRKKEEKQNKTYNPCSNEQLTQADIDKMHFERVWIDYGDDDGEEGIVLYGKLYSIATLDGAGFEDLLLDATGRGGESLDAPSGKYVLYRYLPTGEHDSGSDQKG